jgi:hypothetical protein
MGYKTCPCLRVKIKENYELLGDDYPVYGSVPETSFICDGLVDGGYYADPEAQCQVYIFNSDNVLYSTIFKSAPPPPDSIVLKGMLGLNPGHLQLCHQKLDALAVGEIYKSIGTTKEGGFRIRICMNSHYFESLDPDPHLSKNLDLDPQ